MGPHIGSYARALLKFHHILSSQKKRTIRHSARDLGLVGICKVGYPGVLAVEGSEEQVGCYVREIKVRYVRLRSGTSLFYQLNATSCYAVYPFMYLDVQSLRWASCTLANLMTGLSDSDLQMSKLADISSSGVVMVEKMSEVGFFMRRAGLEGWWRAVMGYAKGG
ncbi:hypothetical protein EW145_g1628 [Phellinidium pouzarii]|uniref:Small nuclear ribonucleoprotein Prp3 C-terminal domain-containing protein n=1 Tax=Phellinidium pouzarii TaxID=167371 RepID=A0A4S4LE37_9AGAM|nr:hypothetical protein EW145_g1628 [Phellinidium pouzarii]